MTPPNHPGILCAGMVLAACLGSNARVLGVGGLFAPCKVLGWVDGEPVAMLDAGRTQGVSLDDRAVLVIDDEIVVEGRVFVLEPDRCAVEVSGRSLNRRQARTAVVVSRMLPGACRIALPAGTTILAHIDRVAPGRRTGWLDEGRTSGLVLGDSLLVETPRGIIANVEVIEVYARQALVRLTPLKPKTVVRPGDLARLWPSPAERRSGQVELPIVAVTPHENEQYVWLPADVDGGVRMDRHIEIRRNGTYMATAIVDRLGTPLSRATTIEAYVRKAVRVGDQALLLIEPGSEGPIGRIFRIDRDYVLISAGEDLGIARGQKLFVVRDQAVIATAIVRTVKATYAGATIQGRPTSAPQLWDAVYNQAPRVRSVQRIGQVDVVAPGGRFAITTISNATQALPPGTLVTVTGRTQDRSAAIVIHNTSKANVLYMPSCWRREEWTVESAVFYSHTR